MNALPPPTALPLDTRNAVQWLLRMASSNSLSSTPISATGSSSWSNANVGELQRDPLSSFVDTSMKSSLQSSKRQAQRIRSLLKLWQLQLLLIRSSPTTRSLISNALQRLTSMRSLSAANQSESNMFSSSWLQANESTNVEIDSVTESDAMSNKSELNSGDLGATIWLQMNTSSTSPDANSTQMDMLLDVLAAYLQQLESKLNANESETSAVASQLSDDLSNRSIASTPVMQATAMQQSLPITGESNFTDLTPKATVNQSNATGNRRNKRNRTRNRSKGQRRKTTGSQANRKRNQQAVALLH